MNCDLCGKVITSKNCHDDSVEDPKLCSSCYEKVKNPDPQEDNVITQTNPLICPKCKRESQSLYQVQDELLCDYCCEERENYTNAHSIAFNLKNEAVVTDGSKGDLSTLFGFLSIGCMLFGIYFQLATLIGFALPVCVLINILTI